MTEPLIVDPHRLASASSVLGSAAADIPVMPPPLSVPGGDLLSLAIAAGSAQIEAPMEALPTIQADAIATAGKVGMAGQRYADTDSELAARAARVTFASSAAGGPGAAATSAGAGGMGAGGLGAGFAGSGAGVSGVATSAAGVPGAAGQAGGLSQMMSMPMQMAAQAGQIPAQLAQAAGAAPQAVMQGAQGAVQQVTQMAGQFGQSPGEDDSAKDQGVPQADAERDRDDSREERPAATVL